MSYPNEFLRNFRPIFLGIIEEKHLSAKQVELEIIDEEGEAYSLFEPADVKDALEQISEDLNFLTIYTERPAYFFEFAETMYEENGLIVTLLSKEQLKFMRREKNQQIMLDFEWEGKCYDRQICGGKFYIPIHKKPWEIADNLDIIVPIGYNTVIVKGTYIKQEKPERDRFEAAFYNS